MTATYEEQHQYANPPPASLVERPDEAQQQLLDQFELVGGTGDPDPSTANGHLFVHRKSAHVVELAQVVEGEVSYISLPTSDIVDILEADRWGGGILDSDVDGWWRLGHSRQPVTNPLHGEDGGEDETTARNLVATAGDIEQREIYARQATPRVELSQTAGQNDTQHERRGGSEVHTIVATKLDLARMLVVAHLHPAIRRIQGQTPSTDSSASDGVLSVLLNRGIRELFGYSRLKRIAMDISPPGRRSAVKMVFGLSVVMVVLAILRIQVAGITGISAQTAVIGQHLGIATSPIVLGLAAISVLKARTDPSFA